MTAKRITRTKQDILSIIDKLQTINKFDPHEKRERPFHEWYSNWQTEIFPLCPREKDKVANLKYWVTTEMWGNILREATPEDSMDLDWLAAALDREHPDLVDKTWIPQSSIRLGGKVCTISSEIK